MFWKIIQDLIKKKLVLSECESLPSAFKEKTNILDTKSVTRSTEIDLANYKQIREVFLDYLEDVWSSSYFILCFFCKKNPSCDIQSFEPSVLSHDSKSKVPKFYPKACIMDS